MVEFMVVPEQVVSLIYELEHVLDDAGLHTLLNLEPYLGMHGTSSGWYTTLTFLGR